MSHSISTLLTRTEDCVFYDSSSGVYRGRDEIDRVAGRDQGYSS